MNYDFGFFDHEAGRLANVENPFGAKVLPMFPVKTVTHVSGMHLSRLVGAVRFELTITGTPCLYPSCCNCLISQNKPMAFWQTLTPERPEKRY